MAFVKAMTGIREVRRGCSSKPCEKGRFHVQEDKSNDPL